MTMSSRLEQDILQDICDDKVPTIVLEGEAGVGKTWLARKVSNSAFQEGLSYGTVWIAPWNNYEPRLLAEKIARQLSILPSAEESDDDEENEKANEEGWDMESLKQKISEKLEEMKCLKLAENPSRGEKISLLAVLDDVSEKEELNIVSDLEKILHKKSLKILITRTNVEADNGAERTENLTVDGKTLKINPLDPDESKKLFKELVKTQLFDDPAFERFSEFVAANSSGLPAAIVMVAEALNQVQLDVNGRSWESALEEATNDVGAARLLRCAYDMLPSNAIRKCFWHSRQLFHDKSYGVHYNELITYWILEGYFPGFDNLEKAYEDGHRILMDLKDRGIMKEQEKENNIISVGKLLKSLDDRTHDGPSGAAHLGLPHVMKGVSWAGLGMITQEGGMIKGFRGKPTDISTMLVDESRLCREIPERFFEHFKSLKVLGIFNSRLKSLPSAFHDLKELQVLVLRECKLLNEVSEIGNLTNLLVLEISGASSLNELKENVFEKMEDLRSVNLSAVNIKELPMTLFNRPELRWLILRDCPRLEVLPSINSLTKLEVLDLSGSASLRKLISKRISQLSELQTLNLSGTEISRLPFFDNAKEMKRLLVRDCPKLMRLPDRKSLTGLQILDVSGSTALPEIVDDISLQGEPGIRVVDLSNSIIDTLPSNISNISHLHMRNCSHIEQLPSTQAVKDLVLLDLSGASSLNGIEDKSFEHLKLLRHLIISNAKVKALPSLSPLAELRQLSLRDCKSLTQLDGLDALKKLVALDLSGCTGLTITGKETFRDMSYLQKLNLSGMKVEYLPQDCFPNSLCHLVLSCTFLTGLPRMDSLSKLELLDLHGLTSLGSIKTDFLQSMCNLKVLNLSGIELAGSISLSHLTQLSELYLADCACEVSGIEALTMLKRLDLSGTKVRSLPSLNTFPHLQQLLLKGCVELKGLMDLKACSRLEVLDLSGTKTRDFPYEISELTCLNELSLKDMNEIQNVDWTKIKYLPEKLNLCFLKPVENLSSGGRPSILIIGTEFFQFLDSNPSLWNGCFQQFHFFVWLPKKDEKGETGLPFSEGLFRQFNFKGRFFCSTEHNLSLELCGAYDLPGVLGNVLRYAEHISLIDNASLNRISELGKEVVRSLKSLWLERCAKIDCIVGGEEDAKTAENLTSLYLCNLPSLTRILSDSLQSVVFANLKSLYLNGCPGISDLFPVSKLPQNLETLQILYCNKLTSLFKAEGPTKCTPRKLHTLHLLDLPNLKSIDDVTLPSLKTLKVSHCPNLGRLCLEEVLQKSEYLEVVCVSGVPGLESMCNTDTIKGSFKSLTTLKIESCPKLAKVFSSSQLPAKLQNLEVKCCDSLVTICGGSSSAGCSLPSLQTLHLWKLPKLESMGLELQSSCSYRITDCPKLSIPLKWTQ